MPAAGKAGEPNFQSREAGSQVALSSESMAVEAESVRSAGLRDACLASWLARKISDLLYG